MATFLKPDNTIAVGGVTVKYYPINQHSKISMPPVRTKSIIGVTIHNTDTINAASGTTMAEQYTRATVNGNMGTVRVHYYVDSVEAWQNLPATMAAWHAADGSGDGNMRTIAIECIMSKNYTEADRKAEDNAARIAADILRTHGLTIDNLYTHTHWLNVRDGKTGSVDYLNTAKHPYKMCPAYILPHWAAFKAAVAGYMWQDTQQDTARALPYIAGMTASECQVYLAWAAAKGAGQYEDTEAGFRQFIDETYGGK